MKTYFIVTIFCLVLLFACERKVKSTKEWIIPNEDVVSIEKVFDAEKDSVFYFNNGMREAGGAILLKNEEFSVGRISCMFKSSTVFGIAFRAVNSDSTEVIVFEPALKERKLGGLYYYYLGADNKRKKMKREQDNFYSIDLSADKWYELNLLVSKSEIKISVDNEVSWYSFKPSEGLTDIGGVGVWGWDGFIKNFIVE
ncbi:MAG: hypothetical protein ACK5IQ_00165 [Bacteroidales bacterium]